MKGVRQISKNIFLRSYVKLSPFALNQDFGNLKIPLESLDPKSDLNITKCFDYSIQKETSTFEEEEYEAKLEISPKPIFKKNSPNWYWLQIKNLIEAGQLKEALELFEVKMVKEEGLPPLKLVEFPLKMIFHQLINACGHAGYTIKAFELFKKMRDYGLDIHHSVYTSLINSCAECPDKQYGIEKLNYLREHLSLKGIPLNRYMYNAMIKAYGKNGDLIQAFALVDEMQGKPKIKPGYDTFVQLMMACTQSTENGFALGLKVWRRMLSLNLTPGLIHFNALLRCLRDCNLGPTPTNTNTDLLSSAEGSADRESLKNALDLFSQHKLVPLDEDSFVQNEVNNPYMSSYLKQNAHLPAIKEPDSTSESLVVKFDDESAKLDNINVEDLNLAVIEPNLDRCFDDGALVEVHNMGFIERTEIGVTRQPSTTKNISLLDGSLFPPTMGDLHFETFLGHIAPCLTKPWQKLAIIGGFNGLLSTMASFEVKPDYKTYTLLAEIMPPKAVFLDILLNVESYANHCWPGLLLPPNPAGSRVIPLAPTTSLDKYRSSKRSKDVGKMKYLEVSDKHLNPKFRETLLFERSAPDSVYYKVLMKRYCKVGDMESARRVMKAMGDQGLSPDITHFGVLALACRKLGQARSLLNDMKELNFIPNIVIMTTLMNNAYVGTNVPYMTMCLKLMKSYTISPNEKFLAVTERIFTRLDRALLNQEYSNKNGKKLDLTPTEAYMNSVLEKHGDLIETFRRDYEAWIKGVKVEKIVHPWQVFAPTEMDADQAKNVLSRPTRSKVQSALS